MFKSSNAPQKPMPALSTKPPVKLRPFGRLLELRRTVWQLTQLRRCGLAGYRLAAEVIASRQCLQRKWELVAISGIVRSLQPAVIVEIGTYLGGTLRCWAKASPSDATLISIDLPGGPFGGGYSAEQETEFKGYLQTKQTLHCLRRDSQEDSTKDEVRNLLGSRRIDFLFIDGDHSYEGVKRDYNLYSPLVRAGGLIAFHDIVPHPASPECCVHEFWRELTLAARSQEIVDRDGFETWGGIGLIRV